MIYPIATRSRGSNEVEGIVFRLEMLPAGHGDSLLLEYGTPGQTRFVLIDGGPYNTAQTVLDRLRQLPHGLELLVVSHIDADHIDGITKALLLDRSRVAVEEIWFNGWPQLEHLPHLPGTLSPLTAEYLSATIRQRQIPWNRAFGGGVAIASSSADEGIQLAGGLRLTLLSPTLPNLIALRKEWLATLEQAQMQPGSTADAMAKLESDRRFGTARRVMSVVNLEALAAETSRDDAVPNGSSIAVLAEYKGASVLLCADAHPQVLQQSIKRLLAGRGLEKLKVDACKVSHHGSRRNTTPSLLKVLDCRNFLISTDGSYFHHPDDEAIARVILSQLREVSFFFNYRPKNERFWDDKDLQREYAFKVCYPSEEANYSNAGA